MAPLAHPHFALTSRRAKSFGLGWDGLSSKKRDDFVQSGFFGINLNDIVVCIFCGNPEDNWQENEKPLERHLDKFPDCAALRREWKIVPVETPPTGGIYPQYGTLISRLRTFGFWPKQLAQKPRLLARAGLFYRNQGDTVTCFMCGVSLMQWRLWDSPIVEHLKYSPACMYARSACKGAYTQPPENIKPKKSEGEINEENVTGTANVEVRLVSVKHAKYFMPFFTGHHWILCDKKAGL